MRDFMRRVYSALKGGTLAVRGKRGCMATNVRGATTNESGWSMEDVKMWGEEVRRLIQKKQAQQTLTYGNKTVMLSKNEPVAAEFWR